MTINWYRCGDGTTQDCNGYPDTMVADATDTSPDFSVWWLINEDDPWAWAAWTESGQGIADGGAPSQQAAMEAAEQWLATHPDWATIPIED